VQCLDKEKERNKRKRKKKTDKAPGFRDVEPLKHCYSPPFHRFLPINHIRLEENPIDQEKQQNATTTDPHPPNLSPILVIHLHQKFSVIPLLRY
jgi:hypothetical protein